MCSQYQLVSDMNAFQTQLAIDLGDIIREKASDFAERQDDESLNDDATFENLSGIRHPTDPVIVVLPGQKPALRRWGLSVSSLNAPLINARAETLDQKPTFRPLLERRCLIPATSWFEWRKEGTTRHKTRITLPDHQPVLFAGLENGKEVVIITCAPAPSIAHIHDRMPAVIGPNHIAGWIDPANRFDAVRHMLGPVPDHVLEWSEEMPDRAKTAQQDDGQITLF
ncbi:SOS response-associated peptidase [Thalassospira australica]|uniref:SOS response-associated peptidase n=1 Tax=Thalassospira australica TaxID=1528106 RepID=UPI00384E5DB7